MIGTPAGRSKNAKLPTGKGKLKSWQPKKPNELSTFSFELAQGALTFSFELAAISLRNAHLYPAPCFLSMSHELSALSWTLRVLARPLNCYETDTFYRILPLFIHQAARTPDKKPKKWLDQLIAGI